MNADSAPGNRRRPEGTAASVGVTGASPDAGPPHGKRPTHRRRWRFLGWFGAVLGLLLTATVLLLAFVLGTQTGLRTLVAVAEDLAPGMVAVERVEGRVLGRLELAGLRLRVPGVDLDIGRLLLDWQPSALLSGRLRVASLRASDLDVVTEPSTDEKPSKPFELPAIKLPLAIDIAEARVERLRYQVRGAAPDSALELTLAELSADASGDQVQLHRLSLALAQPTAELQATGQARLDDDYPMSLSLEWGFQQAPALRLKGEGLVSGDLAQLNISHRVRGSIEARLEAALRDLLKKPSWEAELVLESLTLPEIVEDAPQVELTAALNSTGDLERASVTGTLRGESPAVADMGRLAADLDVEWVNRTLRIHHLHLSETAAASSGADTSPTLARFELSGQLDTAPKTPEFSLTGAWERVRWPLVGAPLAESPQGSLTAEGSLDDYRYQLSLLAFGQQIPETSVELSGTGDQQGTSIAGLKFDTLGGSVNAKGKLAWLPAPSWDLAITGDGLDPGQQWKGLDGVLGLKADTRGDLKDGFRYDLNLDAALNAYPPAVVNLRGTGTLESTKVQALTVEVLGGLIEGQGDAAWAPSPTWTFDLSGRDMDPGLFYSGLNGKLGLSAQTSGGLEEGFRFVIDGDARLARYPSTRVELSGQGDASAAQVERLAIDILGGTIQGDASLSWAPAVSWKAALDLDALDPGQLLSDWPGSLGGRLRSEGTSGDEGLVLTASISDFGGELRGYPVQLRSDVALRDQDFELTVFEARSGDTTLTASGRAGETLDFRYAFDSPSLAALLPALKGRLSASGQVLGTAAAPRLALSLDGRDIEMDAQGVERILANAELGLAPESPLQVELTADNVIAGGQRIDSISVRGQGQTKSHRITIDMASDALKLAAAAAGALEDAGGYRGQLDQLDLTTEAYGNWGLQRAAPYRFQGASIQAGPLCIRQGDSTNACVGFQQPEAGQFVASFDLGRLGFGLLDALTPDTASLDGFMTGKGRFEGRGTVLTGSAELRIPEGEVEVVLPRASQRLVFSNTRLDLTADSAGINGSLQLPVEQIGGIDVRLGLPGFRLTGAQPQPLTGAIQIRLDGLERLGRLLPDLNDLRGGIDGDLQLAGTLDQPGLRGTLAIRDLGLGLAPIGLEVSDFNLTAQSETASRMTVNGGGSIGGGQLRVSGEATGLGGAAPSLDVRLSGDDLKFADSKEYFLRAALDLRASVAVSGGSLEGSVTVPQARIMPRSLPAGAVTPSPDVVLEEKAQAPPFPFSIDVLAKLGDEVLLEAFGLRGLLQGQLRVTQTPGRPLLGDGELQVVDGTYRVSLPGLGILTSVGRPLVIDKGIVLFAKTPLDNPGIILNAQRQGGDVTAGVRVLGTLRNPKLAFFSESDPNLTQSEITSYLVTGIPPRRGGATENRSLSVGTYIAPKLFMEYDTEIGGGSDSIKMRYDLTKSIQVQSETGDAQGVDIFYKFEN